MHNMSTDTEEHGALGPLANGDDAWISSQYGSSAFPSVPYGNIIVEDLQTGSVKTVVGVANGWLSYPAVTSHVSTFAFQAPGWVANSIVGNPAGRACSIRKSCWPTSIPARLSPCAPSLERSAPRKPESKDIGPSRTWSSARRGRACCTAATGVAPQCRHLRDRNPSYKP